MQQDNRLIRMASRSVVRLAKCIGYSLDIPIDVQISTTSRCNISCKMCPRQTLGYAQQHLPDMNLQQFKTIIDKLPSKTARIFVHGLDEPLLNRHITSMISYAAKKHAVYLWTNGLLLTERFAKAVFDASVSGITFSIDSPRKEQYESIRQGAHFDRLVKNLLDVSRIRGTLYPGVALSVNMTINEENHHIIGEMMAFCVKAGVEQLNVLCAHTTGRGGLTELLPGFRSEIPAVSRLAKEMGIKLEIWNIKLDRNANNLLCKKPWTSMFVRSDGVVEACCIHESRPEDRIEIANLFKDDFRTAWNGSKARAFRRALASNLKPTMCVNCDLLFR